MPTRKLLKDKIWKIYRTQDRAAYEMGINNGTISRIINCTVDPTEEQTKKLCKHLKLTSEVVNKKDE